MSDHAVELSYGCGPGEMSADVSYALPEHLERVPGLRTPESEGWSFEELCLPHRKDMLGLARKYTRHENARAEDIVQAALMKAYIHWNAFSVAPGVVVEHAVRAWLNRIVANTFLKDDRHNKIRRNAVENHWVDVVSLTISKQWSSNPREAIDSDLGDEVRDAIASLSPDHRVVIELAYLQDKRPKEIAKILGIPMGTVGTRMSRARDCLERTLKRYASKQYGLETPSKTSRRRAKTEAAETTELPQTDTDRVQTIVRNDDALAFIGA